MEATIKLDKNEVQEIISEHFKNKGQQVKKVTLDIGLEYDAHPGSTARHPRFKNALVEINVDGNISQLGKVGH